MSSFRRVIKHCLSLEQCLSMATGFKGLLTKLMLGVEETSPFERIKRNPCLNPSISPKGQRKWLNEKSFGASRQLWQINKNTSACCKGKFSCHSIEWESNTLSLDQKSLSENKDQSGCIWNTLLALSVFVLRNDSALTIDSVMISRYEQQLRWPCTRQSRWEMEHIWTEIKLVEIKICKGCCPPVFPTLWV